MGDTGSSRVDTDGTLLSAMGRLTGLLENPEPGIGTWHVAVAHLKSEVRMLLSADDATGGDHLSDVSDADLQDRIDELQKRLADRMQADALPFSWDIPIEGGAQLLLAEDGSLAGEAYLLRGKCSIQTA
jgi:hypothetical protein